MRFAFSWAGIDLRRRWRSLVVLALLLAFATATVLTAVAGARRGASAGDRLLAPTLAADLVVLPNEPGFNWNAVRALPSVAAIATFPVNSFTIDGISPADNVSAFPPGGTEVFRTIERPVVIEGRIADLARPDEVMVTPFFVKTYHLGVGDELTLRLFKPETADATWGSWYTGKADGPAVKTRIVGVIRSPWHTDYVGGKGGVIPSPGLFATYQKNIAGSGKVVPINALVRLKNGVASLPEFRAGLVRVSGRSDIDIWVQEAFYAKTQKTNEFESLCLLAFGIAALFAAGFLVGPALARYTAATVADLQSLQATGLTRRLGAIAASLGPALAAVVGVTVGVGGAVAASPLMPIGAPGTIEPSPGLDIDWLVLVPGWLLAILAAAAGTVAFAYLAFTSNQSPAAPPQSAIARAAARLGLPVAVVVGSRFALEPGRGRSAVPVRPAIVGAVAGVLGVLAALTFAAGVSDAANNPRRFGVTYESIGILGIGEISVVAKGDVPDVLKSWAKDPDVVGLVDARIAVAESDKVSVTLFSFAPLKGTVETVLTDGRMPRAPDEVVLAPDTAKAAGVQVGSVIKLTGSTETQRPMTVTGIGFVPEGAHNGYADGGWVTGPGYAALFTNFKYRGALLDLRDGVDVEAVQVRLQKNAGIAVKGGEEASFEEPTIPQQLYLIRDVQVLPIALGAFLAVLAMGAVGHALATGVRRRRHDVAVLRAVGMTPWQSRAVVITQASLLALIGVLVGVPVGFVLGRSLWREVAELMPFAYHPPVVLLALLLCLPIAVLVSNLLAAWPGHRAARLQVGHTLRAE